MLCHAGRYGWRWGFARVLSLGTCAPLSPPLPARSFRIGFGALEAFRNDEGTRSFLSAAVGEGRRELCGAIRAVDRAFRLFCLPAFHQVAPSALRSDRAAGQATGKIDRGADQETGTNGQLAKQWWHHPRRPRSCVAQN